MFTCGGTTDTGRGRRFLVGEGDAAPGPGRGGCRLASGEGLSLPLICKLSSECWLSCRLVVEISFETFVVPLPVG
jgi:hypothetical protein